MGGSCGQGMFEITYCGQQKWEAQYCDCNDGEGSVSVLLISEDFRLLFLRYESSGKKSFVNVQYMEGTLPLDRVENSLYRICVSQSTSDEIPHAVCWKEQELGIVDGEQWHASVFFKMNAAFHSVRYCSNTR